MKKSNNMFDLKPGDVVERTTTAGCNNHWPNVMMVESIHIRFVELVVLQESKFYNELCRIGSSVYVDREFLYKFYSKIGDVDG